MSPCLVCQYDCGLHALCVYFQSFVQRTETRPCPTYLSCPMCTLSSCLVCQSDSMLCVSTSSPLYRGQRRDHVPHISHVPCVLCPHVLCVNLTPCSCPMCTMSSCPVCQSDSMLCVSTSSPLYRGQRRDHVPHVPHVPCVLCPHVLCVNLTPCSVCLLPGLCTEDRDETMSLISLMSHVYFVPMSCVSI